MIELLDGVWNLRALTGVRTWVARLALIGLAAYQSLATQALPDLPDIPPALYASLVTYFTVQITKWSREHAPPA